MCVNVARKCCVRGSVTFSDPKSCSQAALSWKSFSIICNLFCFALKFVLGIMTSNVRPAMPTIVTFITCVKYHTNTHTHTLSDFQSSFLFLFLFTLFLHSINSRSWSIVDQLLWFTLKILLYSRSMFMFIGHCSIFNWFSTVYVFLFCIFPCSIRLWARWFEETSQQQQQQPDAFAFCFLLGHSLPHGHSSGDMN